MIKYFKERLDFCGGLDLYSAASRVYPLNPIKGIESILCIMCRRFAKHMLLKSHKGNWKKYQIPRGRRLKSHKGNWKYNLYLPHDYQFFIMPWIPERELKDKTPRQKRQKLITPFFTNKLELTPPLLLIICLFNPDVTTHWELKV